MNKDERYFFNLNLRVNKELYEKFKLKKELYEKLEREYKEKIINLENKREMI